MAGARRDSRLHRIVLEAPQYDRPGPRYRIGRRQDIAGRGAELRLAGGAGVDLGWISGGPELAGEQGSKVRRDHRMRID